MGQLKGMEGGPRVIRSQKVRYQQKPSSKSETAALQGRSSGQHGPRSRKASCLDLGQRDRWAIRCVLHINKGRGGLGVNSEGFPSSSRGPTCPRNLPPIVQGKLSPLNMRHAGRSRLNTKT